MCVRALDPGSRALLDLSLRRRLPFETMAGVLHTDPFDLARRRARAVARIAAELDLEGAGVVATVKAALARLPDDAWGVPVSPAPERAEPAAVQEAVQAEAMAEAARALMEKLREHRERVREASIAAADPAEQPTVEMEVVRLEEEVATEGEWSAEAEADPNPADQPTVESEAIVLPPQPEAWQPVAATPMAAAFSHHPAFAVEMEDRAADLPPLAVALAQAAASEQAAAEAREREAQAEPEAAAQQPTVETDAIRTPAPATDRPAPPLTASRAAEREPRRRLARGGLIVGLLLALLRLLVGRR